LSQRTACIFFLWCGTFLFGCTPKYAKYISNYHYSNNNGVPDYSNLNYWAANPGKKSLSDSIPKPLQQNWIRDSSTDVFFIHPTTFVSSSDERWNADINDSVINAKTDYSTILFQASVFNECRIFAPRYRQAHLRAYYTIDTVSASKAFELAYEDIKTAFEYYLVHHNHGRPIIIASHSQGTTHAKRLLKEFFDGKPLQKQLVAAYIIGIQIPRDYFSNLRACSDSTQTGCIIGWRTYKRGFKPPFVQKETGGSLVVNPLTWKTDTASAPKNLNKGGVLTSFNRIVPEVADAQIHGDVLWTHRPHFPGSFLFRTKIYHIGDINLYYLNIRENLRSRVAHFHSGS
jgi:hypothetical protein